MRTSCAPFSKPDALGNQLCPLRVRIDQAKGKAGRVISCRNAGFACGHHCSHPGRGGNNRIRGDVAAASEILRERQAHKRFDHDVGKERNGQMIAQDEAPSAMAEWWMSGSPLSPRRMKVRYGASVCGKSER